MADDPNIPSSRVWIRPVRDQVFVPRQPVVVMEGQEPATTVTVASAPGEPAPEIPDWLRARVRTFAQTAGGTLVTGLAAWALSEYGVDLPDGVTGPLVAAVAALIVAVATVVWMVVVQLVSRYAPWVERLFIMRGAPVYVKTPRAGSASQGPDNG